MGLKKGNTVNETNLINALGSMFKDMRSGKTVYLAFSRNGFYILIFVMAMSVIANVVLVDLLMNAPVMVQKTDELVFTTQFLLSAVAIIAGLWLFIKGVNMVTDK